MVLQGELLDGVFMRNLRFALWVSSGVFFDLILGIRGNQYIVYGLQQ